MFDLTTTEEQGAGNNKNLYIYPGVIDCKIKGWTHSVNQNGKPLLELSLNTLDSEEDGATNIKVFKDFFMTEAGAKVHMPRIKHILTKITKLENIKPTKDLDELVAMLNHLTTSRNIRMLFHGKEYMNSNDELKTVAVLPLNNFAEAIQNGAEYPVVSKENSQLVYDENDPKQLEKLEIQADSEEKTEEAPAWMKD